MRVVDLQGLDRTEGRFGQQRSRNGNRVDDVGLVQAAGAPLGRRHRRLLTKADERLDDRGRSKLLGLLAAGDPKGEGKTTWHAKEVIRSIYEIDDPDLADEFVSRLAVDLQDTAYPPEVRSLGRTLRRWKDHIVAWHRGRATNGPTEAVNNLIKRIKRIAFGFRRFRSFRIRALLYAGRPNWDLLATITPRSLKSEVPHFPGTPCVERSSRNLRGVGEALGREEAVVFVHGRIVGADPVS